jgi:hypothetical protein
MTTSFTDVAANNLSKPYVASEGHSDDAVCVLLVDISGLPLIPSGGKDTGNVDCLNYMEGRR